MDNRSKNERRVHGSDSEVRFLCSASVSDATQVRAVLEVRD